MKLIRAKAACEIRGSQRTQLYADIRAGLLPPPIRRSKKVSVWPEAELVAVNCAEVAGYTKEQLRAFVRRLVAARADLAPEVFEAA